MAPGLSAGQLGDLPCTSAEQSAPLIQGIALSLHSILGAPAEKPFGVDKKQHYEVL
jgi:hypothetical protein